MYCVEQCLTNLPSLERHILQTLPESIHLLFDEAFHGRISDTRLPNDYVLEGGRSIDGANTP